MRILSMIISVAVGGYIAWDVVSQLPASPTTCPTDTACALAPVAGKPLKPSGPGLRIALYDPATQPPRRYEDEAPYDGWIPVESDPAGSGSGEASNGRDQGARFSVARLERSGARGVCRVLDPGKRRCVAVIAADQQ